MLLQKRTPQGQARRVALPPSGAARSQVDQGRRRGYHKIKNYKITTVQPLNIQRRLIQPLQPSCDAQDAAIRWQVDQMGHTSQQGHYNDEFRSAMNHTTTRHQSTSCYGSKRLFTLHTDDTSHNNQSPLEIGALEVECTAEIPTPTRLQRTVRFTYNEASNVIMTVTGSASHMRGSEFCQHKQLCPGYRPMGLSRNSAY